MASTYESMRKQRWGRLGNRTQLSVCGTPATEPPPVTGSIYSDRPRYGKLVKTPSPALVQGTLDLMFRHFNQVKVIRINGCRVPGKTLGEMKINLLLMGIT